MEHNVRKNIRKIIKEKKMLQKDVGTKVGYSEQAFSNMLAGRKIIRAEDILILAEVLSVTPNELLGYEKKE